jgi:hypothetical protein
MPARPLLALLAASALTATVTGSASAQQPTAPPPPPSAAEFCQNVPADYQPFDDLGASPYADAVECLAYVGIALGGPGAAPASSYGPNLLVRRDAMASLLLRTLDVAKQLETQQNRVNPVQPYDGRPAFTDTAGNIHEPSITRLARYVGIEGSGEGRYRPADQLTRAQMATLLTTGYEKLVRQPLDAPYGVDFYDDDQGGTTSSRPTPSPRSAGHAGPGRAPTPRQGTVDRDNMAVFLARFLGYFERIDYIDPAPRRP